MPKGDWTTGHVFISHSGRDDAIVAAIRNALLGCKVAVWDDARDWSSAWRISGSSWGRDSGCVLTKT